MCPKYDQRQCVPSVTSAMCPKCEGYNEYANQCRDVCKKNMNQEPPPHTTRDEKLLTKAKEAVQFNVGLEK